MNGMLLFSSYLFLGKLKQFVVIGRNGRWQNVLHQPWHSSYFLQGAQCDAEPFWRLLFRWNCTPASKW